MFTNFCNLISWWCLITALWAGTARAQDTGGGGEVCYSPGSIAASVILTFLITLLLVGAAWFWWKKYRTKTEHLILETDPEKGKGEYAFDNPGFKDSSLIPATKTPENQKLEASGGKSKWNHWSPLSALTTKSEKRKTQDDTAVDEYEVKVIALRSHDFTGLGFNICGNMKEGIFIKDILHRGPAFESGKLNSGDRIHSVTISFEHMVYEDALTILSYASPYEVIIEAKSGRLVLSTPGQGGQPSHPVYRSSSCVDLYHVEKSSKKKLFGEEGSLSSNYSSLQKSRSNMTTLERKESKSPKPAPPVHSKSKSKHLTPEQLKTQLEQKILPDHQHNLKSKPARIETVETQKTENKYQKFGIRVLPLEQQKSPKSNEQNENNINIEKNFEVVPQRSIDEVDKADVVEKPAPPIKKREKKVEDASTKKEVFERNSLNGSGIKRDENGIPQEIPSHMFNAAVVARNNRKSVDEKEILDEDEMKTPKRKGKAPSPPEETPFKSLPTNFDEIQPVYDEEVSSTKSARSEEKVPSLSEEIKNYNSDSDIENDNHSSVNTIELNSSDITIHQTEEEERQNRKTVSTGDLTKIKKTKKSNAGTLERAQSLDISDSNTPKKRKQDFDLNSDEDIFGKLVKEPRLSLILDGLNTFQRNRLKKSTEWGNLEDAILKLNQDDDSIVSFDDKMSLDRISLTEKTPEFDAVVNKINEIKRESLEMETIEPMVEQVEKKTEKIVKNEIWPGMDEQGEKQQVNVFVKEPTVKTVEAEREEEQVPLAYERRQQINLLTKVSPPKRVVHNNINEPFEGKSESPKAMVEDVDTSRVNVRQRAPDEKVVVPPPPETEKPQPEILATEEWNIVTTENIMNTSPPASLEIEDEPKIGTPEPARTSKTTIKPEEVLSKIPLLNSMVKNQQQEALKKPLLSTNSTDETKTVVTYNTRPVPHTDLQDITQNFLYTEQLNCSQDDYTYPSPFKTYDTNVSDDIKVSRHSYGSLERQSPKSDDAKSEDSLRHVSNVNVTNGDSELHSLELSINEPSDFYTTALDSSIVKEAKESKSNDSRVTISTPDLIKNVTLAEALSTLNNDYALESPKELVEVTENKFSTVTESSPGDNSTLTYITEIKVTPNNGTRTTTTVTRTNVSEVEIIPPDHTPKENGRSLEKDFENYVKSFESKLEQFENNIQNFDKNLEEFIKEEPTSIVIDEKVVEKEVDKIQEIAEEQLKKLPEMRFTTSSYESPSRIPEKRQSQIELLRSNFEKVPAKPPKPEITKSRIPIATTTKTPPTSPERRDSRNLDLENDKAILELMSSSSVTSTPYSTSKYQIKSPTKNITVTSIRNNSKIPSGLPVLSGGRPPVAPRRSENSEGGNVVHISANGSADSSFKQWVFNPANVTNVSVTENKEK